MDYRTVITEALALLENPENVAQARVILQQALVDLTPAELTPEQRHDLDTDPTVQDALARIQARTDGGSYLSAPSGGPSTTPYIPTGPLRPVSDAELTLLGF